MTVCSNLNINHTSVPLKILKYSDKIKNSYIGTVQKVSEAFDVPVKNVKSRTTAKVSVSAPHIPTSNLNILKANLGTLFL